MFRESLAHFRSCVGQAAAGLAPGGGDIHDADVTKNGGAVALVSQILRILPEVSTLHLQARESQCNNFRVTSERLLGECLSRSR